jgi:hypothetical protein
VKTKDVSKGKTVLVRIRHNVNCTYHSLHLGTVMFTGETEFSDGMCYGIELEKPDGAHNGRRQDGEQRHFICKAKHGVYVSLKQIIKVMGSDGHRHWKHAILPKDRLPLTPSKPKDLKLREGGPSMIHSVELFADRDDPTILRCTWTKAEEHLKATHLTVGQINRYQLQYRFVKPLKIRSSAGSQVQSSRGHARKAGAYARTGKWKNVCTSSELCGVMAHSIEGLKPGKNYEVSAVASKMHAILALQVLVGVDIFCSPIFV